MADGATKFSWRSHVIVLSAVAYVVTAVNAVFEMELRVNVFLSTLDRFSDAVFNTIFILLLHHHFITPLLHWPAARGFSRYLNDWTQFQVKLTAAETSFKETEMSLTTSVIKLASCSMSKLQTKLRHNDVETMSKNYVKTITKMF